MPHRGNWSGLNHFMLVMLCMLWAYTNTQNGRSYAIREWHTCVCKVQMQILLFANKKWRACEYNAECIRNVCVAATRRRRTTSVQVYDKHIHAHPTHSNKNLSVYETAPWLHRGESLSRDYRVEDVGGCYALRCSVDKFVDHGQCAAGWDFRCVWKFETHRLYAQNQRLSSSNPLAEMCIDVFATERWCVEMTASRLATPLRRFVLHPTTFQSEVYEW